MCKRKEPTTEAAMQACRLALRKRCNSQGSNGMASPFKISVSWQHNEEHLLFQYSLDRPKVPTFV